MVLFDVLMMDDECLFVSQLKKDEIKLATPEEVAHRGKDALGKWIDLPREDYEDRPTPAVQRKYSGREHIS